MKQAVIRKYLKELKRELNKTDMSTIHDALSDAEEYLTSSLENALVEDPSSSEEDSFNKIVEEYGTPHEIAGAYQEMEDKLSPVLFSKKDFLDLTGLTEFLRLC